MKKPFLLISVFALITLFSSCEKLFNKDEDAGTLSGDQSPMGEGKKTGKILWTATFTNVKTLDL